MLAWSRTGCQRAVLGGFWPFWAWGHAVPGCEAASRDRGTASIPRPPCGLQLCRDPWGMSILGGCGALLCCLASLSGVQPCCSWGSAGTRALCQPPAGCDGAVASPRSLWCSLHVSSWGLLGRAGAPCTDNDMLIFLMIRLSSPEGNLLKLR